MINNFIKTISFFGLLIALLFSSSHASPLQDGLNEINKQNFKKAYEILLPLAKAGDSYAQYNLGVMFRDGYGVIKNCDEAKKWFYKSAMSGDVGSQYNYATLYFDGNCFKKDYKMALEWYTKAANNNDSSSQYNLAMMNDNGMGIKKNLNKAEKFYTLAAKNNHVKAQYNLGLMYFQNENKKDLVKALAWIYKAKDNNYPEAISAIDIIKKTMTGKQIKEAAELYSNL